MKIARNEKARTHLYWLGPKKFKEAQRSVVKFFPPIPVNMETVLDEINRITAQKVV